MISDHNDLLIAVETILINHALLDRNHFDDVKHYKFMTPELKILIAELGDRYRNNEQPIVQALWDRYPTLYGKLMPIEHTNLPKAFKSANGLKARVFMYNKLSEYIGLVGSTGNPLVVILDSAIADMETVRRALDG